MTNINSSDFENLIIQSLTKTKTLYAPIPIRSNCVNLGNHEISQSGVFNIQPSVHSALLKFNTAENFVGLNTLATLLLKSQENTFNSSINSTVNQLLKKPYLKNSSLEEANCLMPPTNQLGPFTDNTLLSKPKRKNIRKQTSFAVTDVKSESSSADETVNHKDDACEIERADSEIILNSFGQRLPIKNYNIIPTELGEDPLEIESTKSTLKEIPAGKKMIGLLTEEERRQKVRRYLEKKKRRKGEKSVRYECRQDLASKRFRFQGRFIKFEDLHKYQGKYIIDYIGRKLVKPMFLITKEKRKW